MGPPEGSLLAAWGRESGLSSSVVSWVTSDQPFHSSGPVSSPTTFLESLPTLPAGLSHLPDFPLRCRVMHGWSENLGSRPGLGPGTCQPQPILTLTKTRTSPWLGLLFQGPPHLTWEWHHSVYKARPGFLGPSDDPVKKQDKSCPSHLMDGETDVEG